jgi:hypothetical protein
MFYVKLWIAHPLTKPHVAPTLTPILTNTAPIMMQKVVFCHFHRKLFSLHKLSHEGKQN